MTRSAACLIVKNEAEDIAEWLVHHHLIGFDTLIVYDHQSTDRTADIVRDLGRDIPIILRTWSDTSRERQNAAYRDCLAKDGRTFDWIGFLDADEFLISDNGERVADLLLHHDNAAAVALNWLIFGTSSLGDLGGRLVLEALNHRARRDFDPNRHVKSILRPGAVRQVVNPHVCDVDGITVQANGFEPIWERPGLVAPGKAVFEPWRIHHYFLRTRRHWEARLARGQLGSQARHAGQFEIYDRNEQEDRAAAPHAARVRQFFAERGAVKAAAPVVLCVLDRLDAGRASGWAFDRAAPAAGIGFTALVDERAIGFVDCNLARPDLVPAGYPEYSGFDFVIPQCFCDGRPHILALAHDNGRFGFHRNGEKLDRLEFCLNG